MSNCFKLYCVAVIAAFVWISGSVKAVEVKDLYLVKWPVAEQSITARWKASLAGFKEVLVRKSGSRGILDSYEVQQAYRKVSTDYLQRFEYSDQNSSNSQHPYIISLYFEPRLIDGLIKDAKMPLWGANRPVTILWIAVEENFKRRILTDTVAPSKPLKKQAAKSISSKTDVTADLTGSIHKNAVRRGLPVISPLMDLEDELVVSISDIWGRFPSTILQASERYSADSVLVGRVKKDGEQWTGDFTYINQSTQSSYQVFADESSEVIAKMMDKLAELLCSKYCVLEESGEKNQVVMNVSGVNNFKNFKLLENYLGDLSGVKSASAVKINQQSVSFELVLLGQVESVIEDIRLSQKLVAEDPPEISDVNDELNDKSAQGESLESDKQAISDENTMQSTENTDVINNTNDEHNPESVDETEKSDQQTLYYRWIG